MNLKNIIHEITYNSARDDLGELQCCDGQNPRIKNPIDPVEVDIFVTEVPWHGTVRFELMARYKDCEYEISLCEGCYESIICELLRPKTQ